MRAANDKPDQAGRPKDQSVPEESSQINILKKQLYARDESSEIKQRVSALGQPANVAQKNPANLVRKPNLFNVIKERRASRRKAMWWVIAVVLVIGTFAAAAGLTAWYRSTQQVTQAQLGLSINAPAEFTAGEEITYTINFTNNSRVDWQNVEVLFEPPVGWRYLASNPTNQPSGQQHIFSLGNLVAGKSGQATISGQLLGEQRDSVLARAELTISPANFPKARISRSETTATTIVAVPLDVSIESSDNAASGERLVATIAVRNTSSQALEGVLLRLAPSLGLQLAPEDEGFTADFSVLDSWWALPVLQPLEEASRTVILYVDGQAGERRTLTAEGIVRNGDYLFVQREVNHVLTVSASELSVNQTINDSEEPQPIVAEQKLTGKIQYQNVGTTGLKNVIVTALIEGDGFDAATLKLKAGAYNPTTKIITWTAASVPALALVQPQQKGVLEYEFSILPTDKFPANPDGQNQSLIITAVVDSPDLPTPTGQERKVSSNRLVLPIATQPTLDISAFYDDGRLGLVSSGPLPPEVNKETTYTIRFRFGSTFNDLGEAKMTAVLPDGVNYLNKTYITSGQVDFNERNGEIIWTMPTLEGLSGRVKPAPELHVQVGITPGDNLRGKQISLLQSAVAEGTDMYVDKSVNTSFEPSKLPTTETAAPGQGTVK